MPEEGRDRGLFRPGDLHTLLQQSVLLPEDGHGPSGLHVGKQCVLSNEELLSLYEVAHVPVVVDAPGVEARAGHVAAAAGNEHYVEPACTACFRNHLHEALDHRHAPHWVDTCSQQLSVHLFVPVETRVGCLVEGFSRAVEAAALQRVRQVKGQREVTACREQLPVALTFFRLLSAPSLAAAVGVRLTNSTSSILRMDRDPIVATASALVTST